MKKSRFLIFICVIIAAAAAVLWALELKDGFVPETGLLIDGAEKFARIIAAVIIVFAAAAALLVRPVEQPAEKLKNIPASASAAQYIGAALIIVAAVLEVKDFVFERRITVAVLAALSVFAAIAIIVIAGAARRGTFGSSEKLLSSVPLYWCAYRLMLCYKDNMADPTIEHYIYELLGLVAVMLAFYRVAAIFNGRKNAKLLTCFSIAAFCFTVMYYGGLNVASFAFPESAYVRYLPTADMLSMFGSMIVVMSYASLYWRDGAEKTDSVPAENE